MGRHRQRVDPAEPLPPGLYKSYRQFRARRPGQPWVYFGSEYQAALDAFRAWKGEYEVVKTVAWLLDMCVGVYWPARVKAGEIAPRTAADYKRDSKVLKKGLGKIPLAALQGKHIALYRDVRAVVSSHVRQELGCLAAALTIGVEKGHLPFNVARDVERPTRRVRDRLITHAEYLAVYDKATAQERRAMVLAVRTLGLPSDVLKMGPRNVRRYDDRKTLAFKRGKTGVGVEVAVKGDLAAALDGLLDTAIPTFVHREDGRAYSQNGMAAMFRRSVAKAGVRDFGMRDLRAKGATDMFRAGVPIRHIQLLLGHKSVRTTEIYLKGLLAEIVDPNMVPIVAAA